MLCAGAAICYRLHTSLLPRYTSTAVDRDDASVRASCVCFLSLTTPLALFGFCSRLGGGEAGNFCNLRRGDFSLRARISGAN